MRNQYWTAEDWQRVQDMLQAGKTPLQIGASIGRSAHQVRSKIQWEKTPIQKREDRRILINARRHASGEYKSTPRPDSPKMGSKASPDLLAEAKKRLYAPRTISQHLMGDPAPGYSALDRKRSEVAEAPYVDRRMAQLRKPTLAGMPA